jgi:hypothetical protein
MVRTSLVPTHKNESGIMQGRFKNTTVFSVNILFVILYNTLNTKVQFMKLQLKIKVIVTVKNNSSDGKMDTNNKRVKILKWIKFKIQNY